MTDLAVMLDSGAYSLWSKKQRSGTKAQEDTQSLGDITPSEYIRFLRKYGELFDGYITLDVIKDLATTYTNWLKIKDTGLDPIPVFHAETDWDSSKGMHRTKILELILDEIGEGGHIAIGAISNFSFQERVRELDAIWHEYFLDPVTGKPKYKVHGLGLTSVRIIKRYPWYSVDSTTWLKAGGHGRVLMPQLTNLWECHYDGAEPDWDYVKTAKPVAISDGSVGADGHYSSKKYDDIRELIFDKYFEQHGFTVEKLKTDTTSCMELNACFFMEMAQRLGLRVYFAGNGIWFEESDTLYKYGTRYRGVLISYYDIRKNKSGDIPARLKKIIEMRNKEK